MNNGYKSIIRLYISINALKLGWNIDSINNNEIILSKKTSLCNNTDNNLQLLLNNLINY
jgi:hypothetical protein